MEQEKQEKVYKSMDVGFGQGNSEIRLTAQLFAYSNGDSEWQFGIFDSNIRKHVYKGSLQETIELILLGKLYKTQLQAIDKKEPVVKTCDVCGEPTTSINPHDDCTQKEACLADKAQSL
jgi:hypothetical protein